MREFDFLEPENLSEAVSMLGELGEDACIFAGGTALMLGMRQRMVMPDALISLGKLESLRGISFDGTSGLRIGAATRHADIARSETVRQFYPMLAGMAAGLANPQVRNQGTIGGNLCYADPATDPPTCLIALDATVVLNGPGGERRMPMEEFSVDFFTTALEPGEILTEILIPPPRSTGVTLYRRQLRTLAEHRPLANMALVLEGATGSWRNAHLVIGAATPAPQRMLGAEAFLEGRTITLDVAADAADLVAEELQPLSDGRGDGEFRRRVVRAVARRLIAEAAGLDWKEAAA